MKRLSDQGSINVLLIPFILISLLFVAAGAFAVWAYQSRQDYKDNSDQKVTKAVTAAKEQQSTDDNKHFAEAEKQPLTTYKGPEAYGSMILKYPKTWSAYVDEAGKAQAAVDGYFYPGTVPSISDQSSVFALRVQVLARGYADVLNSFNSQQAGLTNKPKVAPFAFPKVPSAVGVRVDGPLTQNRTGSMVIVPLRDKTLEIWTESPQFQNDFDNNILPNFTFSP